MMTKAECFQELIRKVLHKECELAPMEDEKDDVQGESTTKQRTASVPTNADNRKLAT